MVRLVRFLLVAFVLAGGVMFVGCSSSPSEEEMKQLQELQSQVRSLEDELRKLEGDKGNLEKQIAEKNGKIQQCQADQEAVKKAMGQ